jgi:transposase
MVALKLGRSTYFQWKRKYEEHGLNGLKVRPLPGAASKLTDQQTSQLRGWLVGRDPRQFQFDFALWTRRIVRDLIRQQFDVEMTPQGVGKLLHRLGLSPQRPLYRAYQQNPEAVQRWKQEEFPEIREQARKEGAEVYFGDESGVRTDHHAGTTWAPVGQTPVVEVTGERKSVNMISAVSPGGTLHFDVFFGSCNATVFVEFLKKLMHDAPGAVFLILDNVSFHKAPLVKEYVASLEGQLKLFFLPGYSPELNPGTSAVSVGPVRGRCAGCGAAPPRSRAPGGVAAARALRAPLDLRASAAPSGRACGQAGGLPVGVRSAPEPQPGGWPPVKIVE